MLSSKISSTKISFTKNTTKIANLLNGNSSKNFNHDLFTAITNKNQNDNLKNNSDFKKFFYGIKNFHFVLFFNILYKYVFFYFIN